MGDHSVQSLSHCNTPPLAVLFCSTITPPKTQLQHYSLLVFHSMHSWTILIHIRLISLQSYVVATLSLASDPWLPHGTMFLLLPSLVASREVVDDVLSFVANPWMPPWHHVLMVICLVLKQTHECWWHHFVCFIALSLSNQWLLS